MKKAVRYGLGKLQAEVLEIVWELGEATVAQVVERIGESRPVTYTTVLVAMQKLEKNGWLTHRQSGRAYVYQPARSRDEANASLLKDVLKSAFQGDPRRLLSNLLDECPMDERELNELRKLIDARRKEKRDG